MQFSMFHIAMGAGRRSDRQVYEELMADVRVAEELGFDVFFLAEHHFKADFCMSPSPNVLLGAAAAVTPRLKIGTAVSVLARHHPTRLAEEVDELELSHMLCDFWRAGPDTEKRQRSIRLFGEAVMPAFAKDASRV